MLTHLFVEVCKLSNTVNAGWDSLEIVTVARNCKCGWTLKFNSSIYGEAQGIRRTIGIVKLDANSYLCSFRPFLVSYLSFSMVINFVDASKSEERSCRSFTLWFFLWLILFSWCLFINTLEGLCSVLSCIHN
jgi:hypothetical protein